MRGAALGALARAGDLRAYELTEALLDESPVVRRRACDEAAHRRDVDPTALLGDTDPTVVEAAAFAAGEQGRRGAVPALARVARRHADALCREAAVAALGAVGDPGGLPAILDALGDKPAVRRRAVLALAPFGGPEVDEALRACLEDRDWQVRQAAEDLLSET